MELKHLVSDLESMFRSSQKCQHGIKFNNSEDNWESPFYPTSFMYSFFIFNTLYDIDWKESIANQEIKRKDKDGQKIKIDAFINFCLPQDDHLKEYGSQLKNVIISKLHILQFKPGTEATESEHLLSGIIEDECKTGRIGTKEKKNIQDAVGELLGNNLLCRESLMQDVKTIYKFIYDVRCNIFHGSKTFEMMQNTNQKIRLKIYTIFINSICEFFFYRVHKVIKP